MHGKVIEKLGHIVTEVRTTAELASVDALIIPGGETTTMRKLMVAGGLWDAIPEFATAHPVMGTCAGLVLLGRQIDEAPEEQTLGLIDCDVNRNAYGRQYYSFRQNGRLVPNHNGQPFEMVFIRAPKIRRVGESVSVLGFLDDDPTLIREGKILAMTFHPEITEDHRIHEYFLAMVTEVAKAVSC